MTSLTQQPGHTAPLPVATPNVTAGQTGPLPVTQASPDLPTLTIKKRKKRASGVASNVIQHVITVCDTSGSMAGSKIDEVNLARTGLVHTLAEPENKNGFRKSIIDFSSGARRVLFAESAIGLNVPTATSGGGTNFDSAILETIRTVEEFKARPNPEGWHYLRPQVLFLSDGFSRVSDKNITDLQEIATVTSIAYGAGADFDTLSRIASDGQVHVIGTNGGELRKFLAEVGKTLSQNLAATR